MHARSSKSVDSAVFCEFEAETSNEQRIASSKYNNSHLRFYVFKYVSGLLRSDKKTKGKSGRKQSLFIETSNVLKAMCRKRNQLENCVTGLTVLSWKTSNI